jgi:hypothetical protein
MQNIGVRDECRCKTAFDYSTARLICWHFSPIVTWQVVTLTLPSQHELVEG